MAEKVFRANVKHHSQQSESDCNELVVDVRRRDLLLRFRLPGARVTSETGNRSACHAMVRRREPRGQGEWAGAGRLVRPAPVSTVRSRAM